MRDLPAPADPNRSQATRWRRWLAPLVVAGSILALSSCASVTAKLDSGRVTRDGLRSAEELAETAGGSRPHLLSLSESSTTGIKRAKKNESRGLRADAAGDFLKASIDAYQQLASATEAPGSAAENALVGLHNSSLARFAELWATDPRRLTDGPYFLNGGGETIEIALSPDSPYSRNYFDSMVASDAIVEKGVIRQVRSGCGAPIVAIRERRPGREEEMKFFPERGLHLPVTITVDSVSRSSSGDGTKVMLSLRNPMQEETTKIGRRTFPLAANFSAPIALLLNGKSQNSLSLRGFFRADERIKQSGVFLVEPYDPERIPVILIHGLVSVPMIWRDVFPALAASPELARRYQFMVFTYPSSFPVAESALLLRNKLKELRAELDPEGDDPLSNNMVVAGHSMGGILTHTLIADVGDNLWKQISDEDFESIDLDPERKQEAREILFFSPDPAVKRAIFIAAPHRGAKMAEKGIAGRLSQIARLPGSVLLSTTDVLTAMASPEVDLKVEFEFAKVTAVQSLEPGAPMVAALDDSPIKKGVIYHSIIGDQGKGDSPSSSDGVVEYWSSHMEGAASELIVPTGHSAYKSALAIEEIKRILRLHIGIR